MHFRLQQAKRPYFTERSIDPAAKLFGDISIILVGDFGQLEPIDDWSMCDTESNWATCPKNIKHLWSHARFGKLLTETFQEAIMLKQIHRSKEDLWWTESCLRLRDFTCTFEGDWAVWKLHDLDRGHLNDEQVEYFENKALWLCARCEDVGQRNGRKLAEIAEKEKQLIHQIYAIHSHKSAKKCTASVFDGLRGVVNLVRGCKVQAVGDKCNFARFGVTCMRGHNNSILQSECALHFGECEPFAIVKNCCPASAASPFRDEDSLSEVLDLTV